MLYNKPMPSTDSTSLHSCRKKATNVVTLKVQCSMRNKIKKEIGQYNSRVMLLSLLIPGFRPVLVTTRQRWLRTKPHINPLTWEEGSVSLIVLFVGGGPFFFLEQIHLRSDQISAWCMTRVNPHSVAACGGACVDAVGVGVWMCEGEEGEGRENRASSGTSRLVMCLGSIVIMSLCQDQIIPLFWQEVSYNNVCRLVVVFFFSKNHSVFYLRVFFSLLLLFPMWWSILKMMRVFFFCLKFILLYNDGGSYTWRT